VQKRKHLSALAFSREVVLTGKCLTVFLGHESPSKKIKVKGPSVGAQPARISENTERVVMDACIVTRYGSEVVGLYKKIHYSIMLY
jgi:hypothetical protein